MPAAQFLPISIVIPSFNQGKFIQQSIDSILDQNYPSLEVVVIDGGSTDNTVSILKSYGEKIKWISEKDNGQTHAINKGFSICSGEIYGFLNSDDYMLPGALEMINDVFKDPSIHWLTGDYRIINEVGKPIQRPVRHYKRLLRFFSSYSLLLLTNYIIQPSTYWRRSLMEKAGPFNENLEYVMDYQYWLRLYKLEKPKRISTPLSGFRIHQGSKGGSMYEKQFAEELDVVKGYTNNKVLLFCHKLHNAVIVGVYKLIK